VIRTPRNVPAPQSLAANSTRWTLRFKQILAGTQTGDWATRGAKRDLSAALYKLALGKCVFCESPLGVSGDLEVEHYISKVVNPDLAFVWSNLLPSCRLCNRSKGDQDHEGSLLKPDIEDPEPFFWVHPDTGKLELHPRLDADGRRRAEETIRICNLQRPALCTKRAEMLARVGRWLNSLSSSGLSEPLREEWEFLSDPTAEYKFVIRHVLEIRGYHELSAYDRRRFEAE
jgi:uncharacterized protein (TIGR02646 family)